MATAAGANHAGTFNIGHDHTTPAGENNGLNCSATTVGPHCFRAINSTAGTNPMNPPRAIEGIMSGATGQSIAVFGQNSSTDTNATGVSGTASNGYGTKGLATGTGTGVFGAHLAATGANPGVLGQTNSADTGAAGVVGQVTSMTGGAGSAGVRGSNSATHFNASGVVGDSANGPGVKGTSSAASGVLGTHTSPGGDAPGVFGHTLSTEDFASGVRGEATAAAPAVVGVYGSSPSGWGMLSIGGIGLVSLGSPIAGYFLGNVHVTGTLSKGAGAFRIDHPLDPANKYLQHSFVESPDMMNVYNGNVRTDRRGFATVRLPRYFSALNRDFRYQLTIVGTRGWRARVVDKIRGNRFRIQTDAPHAQVSWQVTGVRKDPYANANRIAPELAKSAAERGNYLSPQLYGKPASRSLLRVPRP